MELEVSFDSGSDFEDQDASERPGLLITMFGCLWTCVKAGSFLGSIMIGFWLKGTSFLVSKLWWQMVDEICPNYKIQ
jgi:hypothetical protein